MRLFSHWSPTKQTILALLFLVVLGNWVGCARLQPEPTYPYRWHRRYGVIHTVGQDETLWRIAKAYGVKPDYLAKVNGIKDPSKLKLGQRLFIPGAKKLVKIVVPEEEATAPVKEHSKEQVKKKKKSAVLAQKEKFLIWPASGRLTSPFGLRWGNKHEGIDISVPVGTQVKAAAAGKVIYSDNKMHYYGNVVIIKHIGGFFTVYAHNSVNLVKENDMVEQGQLIAESGQSGRATGPHVHLELRQGERPINPIPYLPVKKEE